MGTVLSDVRAALRSLRKHPAFTVVAVLTLALGAGVNTAIFSIVNAVLLRPLPYSQPDRLVALGDVNVRRGFAGLASTPPNYVDWRDRTTAFAEMAALNQSTFALTGFGEAEQVEALATTPNFFATFAASPALGRAFAPEDGMEGGEFVAVLSHGFWQRRFGDDRGAIGRSLTLDGRHYTIIGIMAPDFRFPAVGAGADIWVPLVLGPDIATQRGAHFLSVIGRLKAGVTLTTAQTQLTQVAAQLETAFPNTNTGWTVRARSLRDDVVGEVGPALWILFGAVGVVVLIACTNIANLTLVKAGERTIEVAIRVALGAERGRIVRQLLTESLVVAMMGGLAGLALAALTLKVFVALGPQGIPRLGQVSIDLPVLGYTAVLTIITAVVFGLAPALSASRPDLVASLRSARRGVVGSGGAAFRGGLVAGEMALALLLVAGSGALLRGFLRLRDTNPGFDAQNTLTFDLSLPETKYADGSRITAFLEALERRLHALPGVTTAGAAFGLPLSGVGFHGSFTIDGAPPPRPEDDVSADIRVASRGYFEALRIPLRRGRLFEATDLRTSPHVLLISEAMARRYWPNGDAIGKRLTTRARPGPDTIEGEVVGVVGDVHGEALGRDAGPLMYAALSQVASSGISMVIRTTSDPSALAKAARGEVAALDPALPVTELQTMEARVSSSIAQPRFYLVLLGVFATVALVLAGVGLYGVISYTVAQRIGEIGLRRALGANDGSVVRLVVGRAMGLSLLGLAIGLGVTVLTAPALARLLPGTSPLEPMVLAGDSLVLLVASLAACSLPALRAVRVDPVIAMRQD